MSGGGHNGGSGTPTPQSLDAVRKAGLPVGSGVSSVSGGAAPVQSLDAVRAAGLPTTTTVTAPATDFQSILKALQAKQTGSDIPTVEGAGLPTAGTASPTGYAEGGILGLEGNINGQQANPQFNTQSSYNNGQQDNPQFNTQSSYNNYASPNQGLMDYPVEGAGLPTSGTTSPTGYADGGILGLGQQANPQFNTQSSYNNYASPTQGLMDYPQQGQTVQNSSNMGLVINSSNTNMGTDASNTNMWGGSPSTNMGFDNSGSDAGVGGQPVNQMQTPLQGQPPSMSQYMSPQGLQIQGNPTSMPVQRQQQR